MWMESTHQVSLNRRRQPDSILALMNMTSLYKSLRERGAESVSMGSTPGFSLRIKLLFFATALVLIPGGIYGAITLSSSRVALARVVGRQLVEEARNGADRLAATMRSERERLESFAMQDVMREIRIADFDKRISSFLASVKRGCPACVDLLVLDRGGRVVAASNPSWIGKTEDATPGGPDAGETIKGPFWAAGVARALIRFAASVPDPDAQQVTLGRLVALFDWEQGTGVIARARANLVSVGLNVDVLILDAGGVVIGGAAQSNGPWQPGDTV